MTTTSPHSPPAAPALGHAGSDVDARMRSRDNAFDVLRLLAAALVLVSHCFALTGRSDPLADAGGGTMGELGVLMFFAMSGFLVSQSWDAVPRVVPFALKRALRLLPALVVVAFAAAFVLGPIVSSMTLGDYLTQARPYTYALRTSVLVTVHGVLPGVFTDNPVPDGVNGSLWTLPVEASAYVGVVLFGLAGILRRRVVLALLLGLALASFAPGIELAARLAGSGGGSSTVSGDFPLVVRLLVAFLAGMTIHAWRDRLPLRYAGVVPLAVLWVLSWDGGWLPVTSVLFVAYTVLVLAFRLPSGLKHLTRPGDVSYGLYIYAFPLQQLAVHAWTGLRPAEMLAIVIVPLYLLAWASWTLIERRALALKPRPTAPAPG